MMSKVEVVQCYSNKETGNGRRVYMFSKRPLPALYNMLASILTLKN